MAEHDVYTIARFWSKVAVGRSNQCWLWRGSKDRYGYGQFKTRSGAAPQRAHRVAYAITTGEQIPEEIQLLHSCDHPDCCNPAHFRKGDHAENMADRRRKNRYLEGMPRGSTLADADPAALTPQRELFA